MEQGFLSGLRRGHPKRARVIFPTPPPPWHYEMVKTNTECRCPRVRPALGNFTRSGLGAWILGRGCRAVRTHLIGVGCENIAGLLAGAGRVGVTRARRRFARRRIHGVRLIPGGIVSTPGQQKHYGQKRNDFFHGFRSFALGGIMKRGWTPRRRRMGRLTRSWVLRSSPLPCMLTSFAFFHFVQWRVFLSFRLVSFPQATRSSAGFTKGQVPCLL